MPPEPATTDTPTVKRATDPAFNFSNITDASNPESATTDPQAVKQDARPTTSGPTTSDTTTMEPAVTDTHAPERDVNSASSYPTTSYTSMLNKPSPAFCSPDMVKPRPPLDTYRLFFKLWELFAQQQCGKETELPCHVERDPWNSNSTPPSSFWLTDAAASPSAAAQGSAGAGGYVSTGGDDSPGLPKTPSSLSAAVEGGMLAAKRRRDWECCDEYTVDGDVAGSEMKRQKRWLAE